MPVPSGLPPDGQPPDRSGLEGIAMARRPRSVFFALALLLATSPLLAPPAPPALAAGTPAAGAPATSAATHCPAPAGSSATGVAVELAATFTPGAVLSFGLPLPRG